MNAVRSVSELQRVVAYNSQNAIIVRGEADQVALAEKMIHDLDKPQSRSGGGHPGDGGEHRSSSGN